MFESITKFLPIVESSGPVFFSSGNYENEDYSIFESQFLDEFYHFSESHPEMGLNDYHNILGKYSIYINSIESANQVDISDLPGEVIAALIMHIIRAARFNEGVIFDAFSAGLIQKWLQRLQEIDQLTVPVQEATAAHSPVSSIEIHKNSITHLKTDAIVNAANTELKRGGGVCGAIFKAAGEEKLTEACQKIGNCKIGHAVITPAFNLKKNKFIIHAVGPVYYGGNKGEPTQLYNCYKNTLQLAKKNNCHSIGFPLISTGVFGYPVYDAWQVALEACNDFLNSHPDYSLNIVFVHPDENVLRIGKGILSDMLNPPKKADDEPVEVIDAADFDVIASKMASNMPEIAKPLLKDAKKSFQKIEKLLYKAPAFINAVKASIPDIQLQAVLTDEQKAALREGALELMAKKDGTLLAKIVNPKTKKIIKNIPLKEVQVSPEITQAMADYSVQMQLAQIAEQIQVVQKAIEEVRQGQEHDRLATAYSCQQKLLQAREIKNPELRTMALMRLVADAEDSRNLLMLSQKTNVQFLLNQPEGFWGKFLGDGASNEEIRKRMNEIRDSLNAVNLVSLSELMAYQELGEPDAAQRSLSYYSAFIQDTYLTSPGLIGRLDLLDPAPENYWSKTLPDIDKKINALPGLSNIEKIEA